MKTNYKIEKILCGRYNYRGWCIYGRHRHWIVYNEDGYKAWSFNTLKEFKNFIDKNHKKLNKES